MTTDLKGPDQYCITTPDGDCVSTDPRPQFRLTPKSKPVDITTIEDGIIVDSLGVSRLAGAMLTKLARKREEGKHGWNDSAVCDVAALHTMLYEHLSKGDMVDVANFAMMIWNREHPEEGDYLVPAQPAAAEPLYGPQAGDKEWKEQINAAPQVPAETVGSNPVRVSEGLAGAAPSWNAHITELGRRLSESNAALNRQIELSTDEHDALIKAEAEIERLREDALRYRWLRRNCQYGFEDHDGPQLIHRNGETSSHQNSKWREQLDAAIDKARKP